MIDPYRFGSPAAPSVDPSKVVLLLHMDGSNNSTTFVDSSTSANAMSVSGNAKLTTASPKLGSAAAIFDGAGDLVAASSSTFAVGAGDFTVTFWMRPVASSSANYARLIQIGANSTGGGLWIVRDALTNPMRLLVQVHTGSAYFSVLVGSITIPNDVWSHVALTRQSGSWRLFVNGALDGSTTYAGAGNNITSTSIAIGSNTAAGESYSGQLDEILILNGQSLWDSNFAPPSGPFTDP